MREKPDRTPVSNLLDRAIETVSPGWALQRSRARGMLSMLGGYTGGSRHRPALANFNPGSADADSDILYDLASLRGRSRDLARNTPIATGAINTVVTNVVGTGLTMSPRIDARALGMSEDQASAWQDHAQREWKLWAESKDCDATLTQNFYELQALAFRSALESGDVFALTPAIQRPDQPYRLAVQLVEADRICNRNRQADTAKLIEGVVLDEYGAPVSYWICKTHPGALRRMVGLEWVEVPAFGANTRRRNVLHLFERKRPGQTRGVPYLAAVIEPLKQLDRYTEAELQAAVISAAFAIFVKMDVEAFNDLFPADQQTAYFNAAKGWDGKIPEADIGHPGKAINLLPGEDVTSPDLGRPNDKFDPFVLAILRQIGVALELPFEVLIKHFTASYSAARAALLDAWKFFRRRRDWLATNFCQPIYETWLAEAVASGRVAAPGFFTDPALRRAWCNAIWIGDGPGSIDPEKEVNAAAKRIDLGISTRDTESVMYDGVDWESKNTQLIKEEKMRSAGGLAQNPVPAPTVPSNTGPGSNENHTFNVNTAPMSLAFEIKHAAPPPRREIKFDTDIDGNITGATVVNAGDGHGVILREKGVVHHE